MTGGAAVIGRRISITPLEFGAQIAVVQTEVAAFTGADKSVLLEKRIADSNTIKEIILFISSLSRRRLELRHFLDYSMMDWKSNYE